MSDYHLVHEAETVSDMMVKTGRATEEEGEKLREWALMGIFEYRICVYSGNSMRKIESIFQEEIFRLRMGQRWTR